MSALTHSGRPSSGRAGLHESGTPKTYTSLHVPRNNPTGVLVAFCATVLGFALIWRIWWLAVPGLLGVIVVTLMQAWRTEAEIVVPAAEIEAFERTSRRAEGSRMSMVEGALSSPQRCTRRRRRHTAVAAWPRARSRGCGVWLLAVSAVGHPDLRGTVCRLCGAFRRDGRRPERRRSSSISRMCSSRRPACWPRVSTCGFGSLAMQRTDAALHLFLDGSDVRSGRDLPRPRSV